MTRRSGTSWLLRRRSMAASSSSTDASALSRPPDARSTMAIDVDDQSNTFGRDMGRPSGWQAAEAELHRLVAHARRAVPFYAKRFKGCPEVRCVDDLQGLPLLSRDEVQSAGVSLVADGVSPESLRIVHTGGTTGVALQLYRDPADAHHEQAHIQRARARFGVDPDAKIVAVVGRPVGEDGVSLLVPRTSTLWLGTGRSSLSDKLLMGHYQRICGYQPQLVRGYPTMLTMLADLMLGEGLPAPPSVVATESSSEVLHPWQVERIREAFGVPHHNLYGQVEHVAMASSCPCSDQLHVDLSYGFVEILDAEGRVIREPNVPGEVVATGLGNRTTPLIRYRTGDRASWAAGECSCGDPSPRLDALEGRIREVLIDRCGRQHVFGNRFYGALWADGSPLRQAQFRQRCAGDLVVTAVIRKGVGDDEATAWLLEALRHLQEFDLTVETVADIPRTAAGKQLLLIVE